MGLFRLLIGRFQQWASKDSFGAEIHAGLERVASVCQRKNRTFLWTKSLQNLR